jgi:hypothetical protein
VLGATRPNDYEHEFIYAEANVGSRSAYIDLDHPVGRERAERLLAGRRRRRQLPAGLARAARPRSRRRGRSAPRSRVRLGQLLRRERPVGRARGLRHERVSRFGSHDGRGVGIRTPASRHRAHQRLHHRLHGGNRRQCRAGQARHEGGSWHVTVSLTRSAMWCGSLGFVDPELAGCDEEHSLREPIPYDAPTPFGPVHMLAPPVRFSHTPPADGPTRSSSHGDRAAPNGASDISGRRRRRAQRTDDFSVLEWAKTSTERGASPAAPIRAPANEPGISPRNSPNPRSVLDLCSCSRNYMDWFEESRGGSGRRARDGHLR